MKKMICILLALTIILGFSSVTALASDKEFTEAIPCEFDDIQREFSEGLAAMIKNKKIGYIDIAGNIVIPFKYSHSKEFTEGLAGVCLNDMWGYINKSGVEVIPLKYKAVYPFKHGIAPVQMGRYFGFINTSGEEITPFKYDAVGEFSEGLISVHKDYKWGFVDKYGKEVIPCQFDGTDIICPYFNECLAMIGNKCIDMMGNEVFLTDYSYHKLDGGFQEERLPVEDSSKKWGYIDKTGAVVVPFKYDAAWSFFNGLARVCLDGKWGYIDTDGNEVVPIRYTFATDFNSDHALVNINKERWIIDVDGNEVALTEEYEHVSGFSDDGLAIVHTTYGTHGCIDTTGKEVIPCIYDSILDASEGLIPVQYLGKWGFVSVSNDSNSVSNYASEYYYGEIDPGESVILPVEKLDTVTNSSSASSAVSGLASSMTTEQKNSATGADLATLYAETAVAKAASKTVSGSEIIINKAAVSDLEAVAAQTSSAVETALVNGGVTTARLVSNTVTLTTNETGLITIKIDPDILSTQVDKIRVETPTYALTLKVADLEPDLTEILTITAQDVGSGYAASNKNSKTTVQVNLPKGKTTNPVTVSLPKDNGDTTYQAVVKTDGSTTSSKYNPATTTMDGKVTTSGSYTVQTNQKDFTDISNKSAEMQKAIRYLASKGIINGTSDTTFSPDSSISRAEIAALLVRALGKLDNFATNSFTDVKSSDWYYTAAGSSQKTGLINGYPDGAFKGTTTIAKDQILAVSARVLKTEMGYKTPSNPASYLGKYSDTVADWAQPEVALTTKENLVVYRVDGTFKGTGNMTRGDAAIIIYRLFQKIW